MELGGSDKGRTDLTFLSSSDENQKQTSARIIYIYIYIYLSISLSLWVCRAVAVTCPNSFTWLAIFLMIFPKSWKRVDFFGVL